MKKNWEVGDLEKKVGEREIKTPHRGPRGGPIYFKIGFKSTVFIITSFKKWKMDIDISLL